MCRWLKPKRALHVTGYLLYDATEAHSWFLLAVDISKSHFRVCRCYMFGVSGDTKSNHRIHPIWKQTQCWTCSFETSLLPNPTPPLRMEENPPSRRLCTLSPNKIASAIVFGCDDQWQDADVEISHPWRMTPKYWGASFDVNWNSFSRCKHQLVECHPTSILYSQMIGVSALDRALLPQTQSW
jgi:hypothetical protein